jgi:DNA-directed RNA polymerase subunit RPC12/RpoP
MILLVGLLGILALGLVLADVVEARYVLAPFLGVAIWAWARATLRSFAPGERAPGMAGASDDGPRVVAGEPERTLYWCEECSTELLLVVRGSGVAPRHCGTRMHERTELPSQRAQLGGL